MENVLKKDEKSWFKGEVIKFLNISEKEINGFMKDLLSAAKASNPSIKLKYVVVKYQDVKDYGNRLAARKPSKPSKKIMRFYNDKGLYAANQWLGNYYNSHLLVEWGVFRNSEAAYHAAKFFEIYGKKTYFKKYYIIFRSSTADDARIYARNNLSKDDNAWWAQKGRNVNFMFIVVLQKFLQSPELLLKLFATDNDENIETVPKGRNTFWGQLLDGTGKNELGLILMVVRKKLGKLTEDEMQDLFFKEMRRLEKNTGYIPQKKPKK